jgi:hypothetical protein
MNRVIRAHLKAIATVVQVEGEHRFRMVLMALRAARFESNENGLSIRFSVVIIGSAVEIISSAS